MGLVMAFAAWENAILGYQTEPRLRRRGFLRPRRDRRPLPRAGWSGYDVRPPTRSCEATSFSGGNQQKLVLAREMEHDPDLLLVGQPTRGVDIGAIEFIHRRLVAHARRAARRCCWSRSSSTRSWRCPTASW